MIMFIWIDAILRLYIDLVNKVKMEALAIDDLVKILSGNEFSELLLRAGK